MSAPAAPSGPGDSLSGTTLDGYSIDALIGSGITSAVYEATSPDGKPVALKVSKREIMDKSTSAKRFLREAQALKRLDHPGCVAVLDWGVSDGHGYIAMERVEGESLETLLEAGPLERERAIGVATGLLGVLAEAHANGVVHRDIKPANIMLTKAADGLEGVKLLDFGVAKVLRAESDDEATAHEQLTKPGAMFGTPNYMAPEALRKKSVDGAADLYSIGVVLYAMLSGRLPIEAPDAVSVLIKVATKPPTPLTEYVPDIDEPLELVVMKALEKKPADRWPSARAMRTALSELVAENTFREAPSTRRPEPEDEGGGTLSLAEAAAAAAADEDGATLFMAERQAVVEQARAPIDANEEDGETLFMAEADTPEMQQRKAPPPPPTGMKAITKTIALEAQERPEEEVATLFMAQAPSEEEARAARKAGSQTLSLPMGDDDETIPSLDAPIPAEVQRPAAFKAQDANQLAWPSAGPAPLAAPVARQSNAAPILIGIAVALLAGAALLLTVFL